MVFGVILGRSLQTVGGVSYIQFILPGLIVLGTISNAFENGSFSIFHGRWNEYIHEPLTAPLSHAEMVLAYITASVARGLVIGVLIALVGTLFTTVTLVHPLYAVAIMLAISTLFAGFGVVGGLWAQDFDYLTVLNQFIVRPLVFFGGVFYSLETLSPLWRTVSLFNPMVYMVNGVRYATLGVSEVDPYTSLAVLSGLAVGVVGLDILLFRRGYGLME